jgi:purine-binding chemotaxis protein CheW
MGGVSQREYRLARPAPRAHDDRRVGVTKAIDVASLLCSVGARFCAIPIELVVETMRALPIESMTNAPDVVRGLAIVRGAAVPVVDASRLLGGPVLARPGRFVTVRVGERRVALAVESVLGVRLLANASLHALPPLLRDSVEVASTIGALDAQLLIVLQTMRLVPESMWLSLDRRAPS